jgi:hypothetical protein
VNSKLSQYDRGINNTIFLNARGKDVVSRIMQPLRKIGVPTACIFDFDILKKQNVREKTAHCGTEYYLLQTLKVLNLIILNMSVNILNQV